MQGMFSTAGTTFHSPFYPVYFGFGVTSGFVWVLLLNLHSWQWLGNLMGCQRLKPGWPLVRQASYLLWSYWCHIFIKKLLCCKLSYIFFLPLLSLFLIWYTEITVSLRDFYWNIYYNLKYFNVQCCKICHGNFLNKLFFCFSSFLEYFFKFLFLLFV